MKLAVSQIAWSAEEEEAAFEMLKRYGIEGVELVPPRVNLSLDDPELEGKAAAARLAYEQKGLAPVAFQSLLFQRPDLKVFEEPGREACLDHLVKIARMAAPLGARKLVFGSPVNRRIPEGMPAEAVREEAVGFFSRVAAALEPYQVVLAIEPNPVEYQSNFATTLEETAGWVRAVNHPCFRLHLDTGALQMTGEAVEEGIRCYFDLIAHVHCSEPFLAPLSSRWEGHTQAIQTLRKLGYAGAVSLEMKRPPGGLGETERAIATFCEIAG